MCRGFLLKPPSVRPGLGEALRVRRYIRLSVDLYIARFRPAFLEKRRRLLQQWLASILLHPDLGGTVHVKQWVME